MSKRSEYARARINITLAGAQCVVAAALAEAQREGWHIGVAVVDASGELVAFAREDEAISITTEVALGKARTAARLRDPSGKFEDFINAGKPSFMTTPGVTALEGGEPIVLEGVVIGAVGVSGAHGPNDTQVARVAASSLGHRTQDQSNGAQHG